MYEKHRKKVVITFGIIGIAITLLSLYLVLACLVIDHLDLSSAPAFKNLMSSTVVVYLVENIYNQGIAFIVFILGCTFVSFTTLVPALDVGTKRARWQSVVSLVVWTMLFPPLVIYHPALTLFFTAKVFSLAPRCQLSD